MFRIILYKIKNFAGHRDQLACIFFLKFPQDRDYELKKIKDRSDQKSLIFQNIPYTDKNHTFFKIMIFYRKFFKEVLTKKSYFFQTVGS